ncbi:uncharacterized protein V6R79_026233 [Siganus canaliculatus]
MLIFLSIVLTMDLLQSDAFLSLNTGGQRRPAAGIRTFLIKPPLFIPSVRPRLRQRGAPALRPTPNPPDPLAAAAAAAALQRFKRETNLGNVQIIADNHSIAHSLL